LNSLDLPATLQEKMVSFIWRFVITVERVGNKYQLLISSL